MDEGTGRSTVRRTDRLPGAAGGEGQVEFRILGPVEIWLDGMPRSLDGSKQRTVLAALLLARGRILSDDRLSRMLWGDRPPTTADAQLHTHVSRLRKLLDSRARIRRHRPGYLIEVGSATIDHVEFERLSTAGRAALQTGSHREASTILTRALQLWRGPALANVTEHLSQIGLPGLEEARMVALEGRIEADLALGRGEALISELTDLVALYPLRERLRGLLMIALYRCHRQADALRVFHTGRVLLAEELGIDIGPALTCLYQEILSGELGAEGESGPLQMSAGDEAVGLPRPATLPSGVPDFTGRQEELGRIVDRLTSAERTGQPEIMMITGMPGVGKSTLAVRAAHECREAFPDGQLYVDLREPNGRSADSGQVLGLFLRLLGLPESQIPVELAQRICCYRSLLADRRVLVVLDNAVSDGQVRRLLPASPGCGVLITSRSPLSTLEGVQLVDLDPLSPAESVTLLSTIIGGGSAAGCPATAELAELCGGLPMALRVAGARMFGGSHQSPVRLLGRLQDSTGRLDQLRLGGVDVRASLESAYRDLDPRARTALRRLSLLEVPDFASWVTAAVLEVNEEEAEDVMDALVDARLLRVVVRASGPQAAGVARYGFHALVRLMARERARSEEPAAERQRAVARALGAWLSVAVEADRRLFGERRIGPPVRAGRWRLGATHLQRLLSDPLAWFDQEIEALLAVLAQAVGSGHAVYAWETARYLTGYLGHRHRYEDWRRSHEQAWAVTRSCGDIPGQSAVLQGLAELACVLGDERARRDYVGQAEILDRESAAREESQLQADTTIG